ncbi:MAG: protein kinase domain-containing protein [Planctomycetales bacterium]
MPSPTKKTAESFVGLVKQSGLVDHETLKRACQELRDRESEPVDPRAVANELVARNLLTRWQADKLLLGKHKGFFLGKYRLLSHLGSGGMSAVYLAEHVLMRRRVAVKVLPQSRVADTSYLERFHREAQAVASLDHRNIVRAYDVDQEGKNHFLVMEYVAGQSLHELVVKQGPVPYVQALEYIRQAAEGLQHAHKMSMVHRDIKPGNLLLDERGTIKLLDLGLARFFADREQASLTIMHDEKVLGTADFLSPEQAIDSHQVDIRSDIYSLGCTLYFLLTGHPPFPEGTLAQRLLAHQTKQPNSIRQDRPDAPDGVVAILDKMMAKNPDERYQTARDAATAMLEWLRIHGGESWTAMNPIVAGSSSQIVRNAIAPDPGSAGVHNASPVSPTRASSDGATEIRRSGMSHSEVLEPSTQAPDAEPELAAFLSNLAGAKGKGNPTPVVTAPPAPQGVRIELAPEGLATPVSDASDDSSPTLVKEPPVPPELAETIAPQNWPQAELGGELQVSPPETSPQSSALETDQTPDFFPNLNMSPPALEQPSTAVAATRSRPMKPRPQDPRGGVGTDPAHAGTTAPPEQLAPPRSTRRWWLSGAVLAVVALLSIVGYSLSNKDPGDATVKDPGKSAANSKKRKTASAGPVRRELKVGPGEEFRTIGDALADVKSHPNNARGSSQLIRVAAGQTYQERIVIEGELPRNVQIVAEPGPHPILASPGDAPLVTIQTGAARIEGIRLEGFRLDAQGKKVAIRISGMVSGARFKDLEIDGFTESGIQLEGVQAFSSEASRLVLENLTLRGSAGGGVGISVTRLKENPTHIRLQHCRFIGPLAAGIQVDTDVYDLAVVESMFFQNQAGIRLVGADRGWRDLQFSFNTFYQTTRGLVFTHIPGKESREFKINNNLFFESQTADAVVENGYDQRRFRGLYSSVPGAPSHNWTTRSRPGDQGGSAELPLFETLNGRYDKKGIAFQSVNPADPKFLAPAPGSAQTRLDAILDPKRFGNHVGSLGGE